MDTADRRERLRGSRILRALSDDVLDKFARLGQEEQFQPDQVIFEEGDEGDAMFLMLEGAATVQKVLDTDPRTYADLAILEAGAVFGEMALFDGERRSATVRAREPLRVLRITRRDLERFFKSDPQSASAILGGLLSVQNARLREMDQQHGTLYQIANVIAASLQDMDELGRQVLDRLIPALPNVDAGAICVWNPFDQACDVMHVNGIPIEDAQVLSITRDGPVAAELLSRRDPFLLQGIDEAHPLQRLFRLGPGDSLLVAPLVHGEALIGYIVLASRGIPFSSFHRVMVATAATPVAAAIVNHRYAQEESARRRLERTRVPASSRAGGPPGGIERRRGRR